MTGAELKELRRKNGITQKRLSELIKVDISLIKKYEGDTVNIPERNNYFINIILTTHC